MTSDRTAWPAVDHTSWAATCDTLHMHAQVLGKLCVELAPPEPQLGHAALRLTARGWETRPLRAPNGSGAFSVVLDLHVHEAQVHHSDGRTAAVPLTPHRSVGTVTTELLAAVASLAGPVTIDTTPQEVAWSTPLDRDDDHATYDTAPVEAYFAAATQAALVLAEFRAPFRGRSTPVNAWWGSFDLAVSLFTGLPADPPSNDFIMRNAMDAQEIAVGWWPGDAKYGKAAFYAYAHPAPDGFDQLRLAPPEARWSDLGEYLLDWDDVRKADDPHAYALSFLDSVFEHACHACEWDPKLVGSMDGDPGPIR
ncbi:MAG: hypothetical protein KF906_05440 [Actinobacteria bacterium]|nr:hypothetical protein [Actinomycetota bacterium]